MGRYSWAFFAFALSVLALPACGPAVESNGGRCTSDISVLVTTDPPTGVASTSGSCTALTCTKPVDASDGCSEWHGNMLPMPDGGPGQCVVSFSRDGVTTSVTFAVSYCSGTYNTQVGSSYNATVTEAGIESGN
ncbi:MAG TPA: hypothetical protein VF407_03940 [Polyangiaceae bacterium]